LTHTCDEIVGAIARLIAFSNLGYTLLSAVLQELLRGEKGLTAAFIQVATPKRWSVTTELE
jgi:hypothetical protein